MKNLGTILMAAAVSGVFSTPAQAAGCLTVEAGRFQFVLYECDEKVSKSDAKKAESFLAETEQALGVTVAKVEYHKVALPAQVDALTGVYGEGVTLPKTGQIFSTRTFHAHELVHRAAIELGDPGRFFHEGLALALAPEKGWTVKDMQKRAKSVLARKPVSDFVKGFERMEQGDAYAVAGAFVADLIAKHGVERVAELFRRAGRSKNADGAFVAVYGTTLDAATTAWAQAL